MPRIKRKQERIGLMKTTVLDLADTSLVFKDRREAKNNFVQFQYLIVLNHYCIVTNIKVAALFALFHRITCSLKLKKDRRGVDNLKKNKKSFLSALENKELLKFL